MVKGREEEVDREEDVIPGEETGKSWMGIVILDMVPCFIGDMLLAVVACSPVCPVIYSDNS